MMMVVIVMMGVRYSTPTVQLYSTSNINWLPRTIFGLISVIIIFFDLLYSFLSLFSFFRIIISKEGVEISAKSSKIKISYIVP